MSSNTNKSRLEAIISLWKKLSRLFSQPTLTKKRKEKLMKIERVIVILILLYTTKRIRTSKSGTMKRTLLRKSRTRLQLTTRLMKRKERKSQLRMRERLLTLQPTSFQTFLKIPLEGSLPQEFRPLNPLTPLFLERKRKGSPTFSTRKPNWALSTKIMTTTRKISTRKTSMRTRKATMLTLKASSSAVTSKSQAMRKMA